MIEELRPVVLMAHLPHRSMHACHPAPVRHGTLGDAEEIGERELLWLL